MVRYICGACGHRWKGHGRAPGGQVSCPRCGKPVYVYAKAVKPMEPKGGEN